MKWMVMNVFLFLCVTISQFVCVLAHVHVSWISGRTLHDKHDFKEDKRGFSISLNTVNPEIFGVKVFSDTYKNPKIKNMKIPCSEIIGIF